MQRKFNCIYVVQLGLFSLFSSSSSFGNWGCHETIHREIARQQLHSIVFKIIHTRDDFVILLMFNTILLVQLFFIVVFRMLLLLKYNDADRVRFKSVCRFIYGFCCSVVFFFMPICSSLCVPLNILTTMHRIKCQDLTNKSFVEQKTKTATATKKNDSIKMRLV